MLTLRREQQHALDAQQREPFVKRLTEELEQTLPDAPRALGPGGVRREVEAALQRAVHHGFELEDTVAAFIRLVFVLGPRFDVEHAWARDLLAEPGLDEVTRIRRLGLGALHHLKGEPQPL
ncbi:hypothetical protein [Pyxidicoccus trucidator]|uniref:hypothetical protein n=1 Tax=Pyxidicoccus trucidator TaxID=2709662 RepID=UPI0013D94163|nr:hypothetical protein [Pyxidicoccus trucidator]